MITSQLFNLEVTNGWEGFSGQISPKGLKTLETALLPMIEEGNVAAVDAAGKAGAYEGVGFRLEVGALGKKSAIFRPIVISNAKAFMEETGLDPWAIDGVLPKTEKPADLVAEETTEEDAE